MNTAATIQQCVTENGQPSYHFEMRLSFILVDLTAIERICMQAFVAKCINTNNSLISELELHTGAYH
jgi:hypothetical protein